MVVAVRDGAVQYTIASSLSVSYIEDGDNYSSLCV